MMNKRFYTMLALMQTAVVSITIYLYTIKNILSYGEHPLNVLNVYTFGGIGYIAAGIFTVIYTLRYIIMGYYPNILLRYVRNLNIGLLLINSIVTFDIIVMKNIRVNELMYVFIVEGLLVVIIVFFMVYEKSLSKSKTTKVI